MLPKVLGGNSLSSCSAGNVCGAILLFSPQTQEWIAGPMPHALSPDSELSCLECCLLSRRLVASLQQEERPFTPSRQVALSARGRGKGGKAFGRAGAKESVVAKPRSGLNLSPMPWAKSSQHSSTLAWGSEFTAGSSPGLTSLGSEWFRIYCLVSCPGRSYRGSGLPPLRSSLGSLGTGLPQTCGSLCIL